MICDVGCRCIVVDYFPNWNINGCQNAELQLGAEASGKGELTSLRCVKYLSS